MPQARSGGAKGGAAGKGAPKPAATKSGASKQGAKAAAKAPAKKVAAKAAPPKKKATAPAKKAAPAKTASAPKRPAAARPKSTKSPAAAPKRPAASAKKPSAAGKPAPKKAAPKPAAPKPAAPKPAAPKKAAAKPAATRTAAARPTPTTRRPAPRPAAPQRPSRSAKPPAAPRAPRLSDAIKAFEAAVKVFQRGNFANARDSFEKIVERYPNQTEIVARVQTYLSICNRRLERPARTPQTPESLYDQGVVELNRAHYDRAIDLFKRALKSQPHQPHVLYSLAAAQVRSGQTDEGLKTLEQAVEGREIHRTHARNDPDFAALRDDARFQELVGLHFGS